MKGVSTTNKFKTVLKSILFVPANDLRKTEKALQSGADAVTLDLEDAVTYSQKEAARQCLETSLKKKAGKTVFIRINPVDSPYILKDLQSVAGLDIDAIMLAKTAGPEDIKKVDWLLGLLEGQQNIPTGSVKLIPFIESCLGILKALEIAAASPRIAALALGGVDLSQELGISYPAKSAGLLQARSALILASRAAELEAPLDTVYPALKDGEGLKREAEIARDLGFQGKLAVHPAQVDIINTAFSPTPEELEYARRVVEAFTASEAAGSAVIQLDGKMIEYPIYNRAKKLLGL